MKGIRSDLRSIISSDLQSIISYVSDSLILYFSLWISIVTAQVHREEILPSLDFPFEASTQGFKRHPLKALKCIC